MEIKTNDGVVTFDKQSVLNNCKDELSKLYSKLYNIKVDVSEDKEPEKFRQTVYEHKQQLEDVHQDNCNVYLNEDINFQKVVYAVRKVKVNKSSGIDNIPNQVLKQPSIVTLIHKLL